MIQFTSIYHIFTFHLSESTWILDRSCPPCGVDDPPECCPESKERGVKVSIILLFQSFSSTFPLRFWCNLRSVHWCLFVGYKLPEGLALLVAPYGTALMCLPWLSFPARTFMRVDAPVQAKLSLLPPEVIRVLKCKIQRETMGKQIRVSDVCYQGKTGAVFQWFFLCWYVLASQFFIAGAHRNHFSRVARAHGWWRSWGGAFFEDTDLHWSQTIPSKYGTDLPEIMAIIGQTMGFPWNSLKWQRGSPTSWGYPPPFKHWNFQNGLVATMHHEGYKATSLICQEQLEVDEEEEDYEESEIAWWHAGNPDLWPSGKPKDRQNHSVVGKGCTRTPCRAGMGLCAILELQIVAPCSRLLLWCILADGKKPCRFMIPVSLFAQKLPTGINHWLHLPFFRWYCYKFSASSRCFPADLAAARSLRLSSLSPIRWSNCGVCHTGLAFFSTWPLRLSQPFHLKKWLKVQGLILSFSAVN